MIVLGHRIAPLGLVALLAACTFTLPAQPETGSDLLVEIRGEWWPRVKRVVWSEDGTPTIESSDDGAERFAAWRARCREASVSAFDRLRTASAGRLPLDDSDRSNFHVVPSPDASLALILKPGFAGWQLADLLAGTERPWPAELESRLVYPLAWSGDGRQLALRVRDDQLDDAPTRLMVFDVEQWRILHERPLRDASVAWSEDATHLAILQRSMQSGTSVLDKMGAGYGHGPGFLSDFELVVLDLASGSETRIPVAHRVRSGRGAVLWDGRSLALASR